MIDLHVLPPVAAINGARIRELTGDDTIPDTPQVVLRAFRAVVGERTFHAGFCLGNDAGFSAIGIAVIDRLLERYSARPYGTAVATMPMSSLKTSYDA